MGKTGWGAAIGVLLAGCSSGSFVPTNQGTAGEGGSVTAGTSGAGAGGSSGGHVEPAAGQGGEGDEPGSGGVGGGSGGRGGSDSGRGGDAGKGGAASTAGSAGEASAEGGEGGEEPVPGGSSGGGSGGVAGLAGSGGAACVPSIDSWEACGGTEIDRCGPVPDGCTDDGIDCGGCAPNKICSSEGVCEPLYPCDCTDRECGRLTTCDDEARSLCGPDAGECGTGELCFEIGIPGKLDLGTTCRVPTFQTCFAPQETCCDTKPTECSVGYSNCVNFYAVSLATGEPCGSCMTGGIEHKCGPGY